MKPKSPTADEIRAQIALRAYFIWEREGRPQGRDSAHWAMAEAEILGESPVSEAAPVKKKPVKKPAPKPEPVAEKKAPAKKPAVKKAAKPEAKPAEVKKAAKTKKPAKPKA